MDATSLCDTLSRRYRGIQEREDIYQELMLRVVELRGRSDEFIRTAIRNRMRDLCRSEAIKRVLLRTMDVFLHLPHVPARLEAVPELVSFREDLARFMASLNRLEEAIIREMTLPSRPTLRHAVAHKGPEVKVRSCCVAKTIKASSATVSRTIAGIRLKAADAFGPMGRYIQG